MQVQMRAPSHTPAMHWVSMCTGTIYRGSKATEEFADWAWFQIRDKDKYTVYML